MKKNTRKLKKAALLLCSAVLLVCISIGATVAYLTSQDSVTNTFTVGNVAITLDEVKVTPDGKVDSTATTRVKTNQYHLLPGHTYTKDPTIHVATGSDSCYLFVKLGNGIKDIVDATTIEDQMANKGWNLIDATNNIYAYNTAVSGGTSGLDVVVFDNFKIKDDANVSGYANAKIEIAAYAVQSDGFGTQQAAWTATFGKTTTA